MRKLIILLLFTFMLSTPVSAQELTPPQVPESGKAYIQEDARTLEEGLSHLVKQAILLLRPDLAEAGKVSLAVVAAVLMVGILQTCTNGTTHTSDFAGAVIIVSLLLTNTNSMIRLSTETIKEMSEYGKLLLPVMTAAMAAQGGITSSAALCGGTALFGSVLNNLISGLFVPMVYFFLALSAAGGALGENLLIRLRDLIKGFLGWCLKTLLTVFTTYMGITGVLSGSTDAAALKAAKVTISTFVPVVGGILSDASEAVLVSAGLARNAAGLYGILAILALFVAPFVKIGTHYLLLKATAGICSLFGTKRMCEVVADFSSAMGLLLGMTGSACLLQLISTICFMKGVS